MLQYEKDCAQDFKNSLSSQPYCFLSLLLNSLSIMGWMVGSGCAAEKTSQKIFARNIRRLTSVKGDCLK